MNDSSFIPEYFKYYVNLIDVKQQTLSEVLELQLQSTLVFVKGLSSEKLVWRYAEGKWNMLEMLLHIIDVEQVFQYRYLRSVREQEAHCTGFDHDAWVEQNTAELNLEDLVKKFKAVRSVSLEMFKNYKTESGVCIVNGSNKMSSHYFPLIIAGHEKHHLTKMTEILT
jgi:hypothetical protein